MSEKKNTILHYPDGSVYDGEAVDGMKEGFGTLIYPANAKNGRKKYVGEWKNDRILGKGMMEYQDGALFEGVIYDDELKGVGTVTFPDGSIYSGEVRHEKYNGMGIGYWPDGTIYEGEWMDDKMNGKGVITIKGIKYSGEWKDGKVLYLDKWGPMTLNEM